LRTREALLLALLYVSFTAVWVAVGWMLVHPLGDSPIARADQSIARWFVDQRTALLDSVSWVGSMLAETIVKVIVTGIVAIAMLVAWRRWLEPLMVVIPLVLEAMCFITVTAIVGRPRPDVVQLDSSPVGSSYPSGHMGAAVAYAAIVVVIFWHTRRRWIRTLAVVIGVFVPVAVGLSRMYRGMHYLTDIVMGALLGGACVAATAILLRRAAERHSPSGDVEPISDVGGHLIGAPSR
jgi:undecaprenyl-diphosphatase